VGLFKKENRPQTGSTPAVRPATENRAKDISEAKAKKESGVSLKTDDITTILGKGSEFEGKLQFEGTLRIEGVFAGEIHSDSILVVGEGAKVSAEVDVGTIIINGEVNGNVRAKQGVEIRNPGKLVGNVATPSLIIEKGVLFDGTCKMDSRGSAGAPPAFPPKVEEKKKPAENKNAS
jgi:cytoskeletal protein CcmA (bactofilin family)